MSRVCLHILSEDGSCSFCGSSKWQIAAGWTCVWRDVPDTRLTALRPEPALRKLAHEDADAISARLAELRKESDVAINHVEDK